MTRALTTQALHGDAAARELLERARALAREGGSAYVLALADVQESGLRLALGDYREVLRLLRRVRPGDLRHERERFVVLLHRGIAHANLAELGPARGDLEEALAVAQGLEDPALEAKALHDLGVVAHLAGDLPTAIRLLREVGAMPVPVGRARAGNDLASALLDAGLVDEAVRELDGALEAARADRQGLLEGELRVARARAMLLLDDLPAARRDAVRAARAFRSRDDESRARYAELLAGAPAGGPSGRAGEVPRAVDPWISRFAARVRAEGHLDRGEVEQARSALREARAGRTTTLGATLHEHHLRARLALAEGRAGAARRSLRAAAAHLAAEQGRNQSLEVRAAIAVHGRNLAALDLEAALGSGAPREVYAAAERWRAASGRVAVGAVEDPRARTLLEELRVARHAATSSGADPATAQAALARTVELEAAVSRRLWSAANAERTGPALAAGWGETRAALAARGATLVLFVVSGDRYHRLAVGPRRADLARLGTVADVDRLVRRLSSDLDGLAHAGAVPALRPVLERACDASALALDEALLAGLPRADEPVLLGPTRALGRVPWARLPSLRGRPLTVAGSVTRWVRTPTSRRQGPVTVAALAGPGLDRAEAEVEQVAATWRAGDTPAVTGSRAADLVAATGGSTLVHVAAHGTHEEQSPLFSSVRLQDGPVVVHELPRPPAAEHVVLSACDVGRSHVRPGDEALGLTAGLLGIGVGSVVASVAPVTDVAASAASVQYHRGLARGLPASEALAYAVSEVPDAAAFALFGADWSR